MVKLNTFPVLLIVTLVVAPIKGDDFNDNSNDLDDHTEAEEETDETLIVPINFEQVQPKSALNQTGKCGQTRGIYPASRIVGGRKALDGEFPWQVSLQFQSPYSRKGRHFCGASVLNERWIVTAAHCLQGQSLSSLRAVVGTSDLSTGGQSLKVSKMIIHEQFSQSTVANDIALLRTSTDIPLFTQRQSSNQDVNSICLPSPVKQFTGSATVSGYGSKKEGGNPSTELLATDLDIQPDRSCQSQYSQFTASRMVCAGHPAGGKDTCQGDSGGPMVQKNGDSSTLVGITSFGRGCARAQTPGVYTRVSSYIDWIEKNAK